MFQVASARADHERSVRAEAHKLQKVQEEPSTTVAVDVNADTEEAQPVQYYEACDLCTSYLDEAAWDSDMEFCCLSRGDKHSYPPSNLRQLTFYFDPIQPYKAVQHLDEGELKIGVPHDEHEDVGIDLFLAGCGPELVKYMEEMAEHHGVDCAALRYHDGSIDQSRKGGWLCHALDSCAKGGEPDGCFEDPEFTRVIAQPCKNINKGEGEKKRWVEVWSTQNHRFPFRREQRRQKEQKDFERAQEIWYRQENGLPMSPLDVDTQAPPPQRHGFDRPSERLMPRVNVAPRMHPAPQLSLDADFGLPAHDLPRHDLDVDFELGDLDELDALFGKPGKKGGE